MLNSNVSFDCYVGVSVLPRRAGSTSASSNSVSSNVETSLSSPPNPNNHSRNDSDVYDDSPLPTTMPHRFSADSDRRPSFTTDIPSIDVNASSSAQASISSPSSSNSPHLSIHIPLSPPTTPDPQVAIVCLHGFLSGGVHSFTNIWYAVCA